MKYINLSLHRSATSSIAKAFRDFGIATLDWVGYEFEAEFQVDLHHGKLDAVFDGVYKKFRDRPCWGDYPVPWLYEKIADSNPDAYFFSVIRFPRDWIASSKRHNYYITNNTNNPTYPGLSPACASIFAYYGMLEDLQNAIDKSWDSVETERLFAELFVKHYQRVSDFCSSKGLKYREFYIDDEHLLPNLFTFCDLIEEGVALDVKLEKFN